MVTVFLLVTGIVYSCYCGGQSIPHQERQSRLSPNYEPFQHPAKKVLSTPTYIYPSYWSKDLRYSHVCEMSVNQRDSGIFLQIIT